MLGSGLLNLTNSLPHIEAQHYTLKNGDRTIGYQRPGAAKCMVQPIAPPSAASASASASVAAAVGVVPVMTQQQQQSGKTGSGGGGSTIMNSMGNGMGQNGNGNGTGVPTAGTAGKKEAGRG